MPPSSVSVTAQFLVAIRRLVVVQQRDLLGVARLEEQPQRLAHTGWEQQLVVEVHTDHLGEVSFAVQLGRQG